MARRDVGTVAARADRISRSLEHDARAMAAAVLRDPDGYARRVIAADNARLHGDAFTRAVNDGADYSPHELRYLSFATREAGGDTPFEDWVQVYRWARHRIVYAIDPDTAAAVAQTDWADTPIPGDVLRRRLPHVDPMIVLPAPIRLPSYDGKTLTAVEKYDAVMITGAADRSRASTHDPDVDALRLHFLSRKVDPVTDRPITIDARQPDGSVLAFTEVVGFRLWVDLTTDDPLPVRQQATIDAVFGRGRFTHQPNIDGFRSVSDAERATADMVAYGLALLTYLVTDDADLITRTVAPPAPRKPRRGQRPADPGSPTTVVEVGYRVGAALRNAARGDGGPARPGDGTRTVRPHLRRAHLHRFWKGPRSDPSKRFQVLHWIPPTPVAYKDDQKPDTTQIHLP